ncbi:MAG: prolipoprotein diacylglyceryl transferase [Candidatus Andersenbacteria bacterium]
MNPGFSIGPLRFYYYGLILAAALVVAYLVARRRAPRFGVPLGLIDAALLVVAPLGVVGARLYYVAFSWDYYQAHLGEILRVQDGGLAIHGALLGGLLGMLLVWWYYRMRGGPRGQTRLRFSAILDVLAPALPLAQAIGRLANYVNHEAFGLPTTLPFGIYIPPDKRPAQFAMSEHFHPTFAYELIWNLIGVVLVLATERWFKKRAGNGQAINRSSSQGALFAVYLGWYSLGRLWIEALRTDALLLGPLRIAQLISAAAVLGSAGYLWYRGRQWRATNAS